MATMIGRIRYLYCFIGESGSGKDTIVNAIHEKYNIPIVMSYTARPRRYKDENCYIFSDEETYQEHLQAGIILEQTQIEGKDGIKYHYWTNKDQYDEKNFFSKKMVICDPEGFSHLKNELPHDVAVIGIHVKADENTRYKRIYLGSQKASLSERMDEAKDRLNRSKEKFKLIQCNYVVDNNGDIDDTIDLVKTIMNLE